MSETRDARHSSSTLWIGITFAALVSVILIVVLRAAWPVGNKGGAPIQGFAVEPAATVANHLALSEPRQLPDLQFDDAEGQPRTLADFRGQVILLNVWATWCVPCRKEMPTLDRLQASLGSRNFRVLALSIDRAGVKRVQDFYAEIGVKHLSVFVDQRGQSNAKLGLAGIPTSLLIDRDGREIGRLVGPAEWDSAEMVGVIRRAIGEANAENGTKIFVQQAPSEPPAGGVGQ